MTLYTDLPAGAEVARAARSLDGQKDGTVVGYHPVARMNPFQSLIYSRAPSLGFAPVGILRRENLASLEVASAYGYRTLLHLHWTSAILADAEDEIDARSRAQGFLTQLEKLKASGTNILWTVHNVLPHRCPFPNAEATMRQAIVELADVIHVMTPDTIEQTSGHYELPPERTVEVPHPSYLGAYPQSMGRDLARFELGYEPGDIVVGSVGSIQAYKGLDRFAMAIDEKSATSGRLRAIVAGIPGRDSESSHLIDELSRHPYLRIVPRKLDPTEISMIVSALDASVFPYRASLNSGAALLSISYGVPIVAPAIGHFHTLTRAGLGIGYDPGDENGLSGAIAELPGFLEGFDPHDALAYAHENRGASVSERLFTAIAECIRPQQ